MQVSLDVYVPLGFEEAHVYIDSVISQQGFSLSNPHKPTVSVTVHTADGLGEIIELEPDELKRRFCPGDILAVQYWSGNADILVVWTPRGKGWNVGITCFVQHKKMFNEVAKELFSNTLEKFYANVDDKPVVTLIFD